MKSQAEFRIIVRVASLVGLFDCMDPSPFRERDLAGEAEESIAGWAQDSGRYDELVLVIRLPESECSAETEQAIMAAVANHFG